MAQQKISVVTGAGGGIGRQIATKLATNGFTVVCLGRTEETLRRAVEEIKNIDNSLQAHYFVCDVSNEESVVSVFKTIEKEVGMVDILINNAAGFGPTKRIAHLPFSDWREVMATNVDGLFLTTRAVLPGMRLKKWGHILNISSMTGKFNYDKRAAYSLSKSAIVKFTELTAAENTEAGVIVNALILGYVRGELLDRVIQNYAKANDVGEHEAQQVFFDFHRIQPILTADDVAEQILLELTTKCGRLRSGREIFLDCGCVMY